MYTGVGVLVSSALYFFVHSFARPPPRTMTKEWQEATTEYLKVSPFLFFIYDYVATPTNLPHCATLD